MLPKLFGDREEYQALTFDPSELYGPVDISQTLLAETRSIYSLNDQSVPWIPRYAGAGKNVILLGNTRVRQLRVARNRCEMATKEEFEAIRLGRDGVDAEVVACYAPFHKDIQSTIE